MVGVFAVDNNILVSAKGLEAGKGWGLPCKSCILSHSRSWQWIALVICTVWKQRRQKKYKGKNTQGLHRGGLCTRGGIK